jgi:RNA polymerase sigma factor (sigma-70 family)
LRCSFVNALSEAVVEMKVNEQFDLESIFLAQYDRVARVIAKVVRDHARAEELAVEVFLKLGRNQKVQGNQAEGWLYRVAVRTALDELRRQTRRDRYESLFGFARRPPTPEEIHTTVQEQERVRLVLSVIARRHAEILLLRSQDLSYSEVALASQFESRLCRHASEPRPAGISKGVHPAIWRSVTMCGSATG